MFITPPDPLGLISLILTTQKLILERLEYSPVAYSADGYQGYVGGKMLKVE